MLHPSHANEVLPAGSAAPRALDELAESLTRRELEVLQMLAAGLSNKEIAARLNISEHTVKFHVASILGKLGAASRTEAVSLGIRRGLVLAVSGSSAPVGVVQVPWRLKPAIQLAGIFGVRITLGGEESLRQMIAPRFLHFEGDRVGEKAVQILLARSPAGFRRSSLS